MPARKPIFEPTMFPNCVLWLRADQGMMRDEANGILQWNDLSGNANHAAMTSTGTVNRGLFVVSAQGIRPAMRTSLATQRLVMAGPTFAAQCTLIGVFSKSSTASGYLLAGPSNNTGLLSNFSSVSFEFFNSPDRYTFSSGSVGSHVLSVRQIDGVNNTMWFDGTQVQSNVPTVALNGLQIRRLGSSNSDLNGATSDYAEVIVYNRALTNAERNTVERYLGNRYRIPVAS